MVSLRRPDYYRLHIVQIMLSLGSNIRIGHRLQQYIFPRMNLKKRHRCHRLFLEGLLLLVHGVQSQESLPMVTLLITIAGIMIGIMRQK